MSGFSCIADLFDITCPPVSALPEPKELVVRTKPSKDSSDLRREILVGDECQAADAICDSNSTASRTASVSTSYQSATACSFPSAKKAR